MSDDATPRDVVQETYARLLLEIGGELIQTSLVDYGPNGLLDLAWSMTDLIPRGNVRTRLRSGIRSLGFALNMDVKTIPLHLEDLVEPPDTLEDILPAPQLASFARLIVIKVGCIFEEHLEDYVEALDGTGRARLAWALSSMNLALRPNAETVLHDDAYAIPEDLAPDIREGLRTNREAIRADDAGHV